jgi:glutamate-ammonia-ligase adenylyltransferase
MALTRARVVAGPGRLAAEIEDIRCAVIAEKAAPDHVRAEAAAMRARLAAAGRAGGTWAVKDGPGGMQEIELLGQAAALASGCAERVTAAQLAQAEGLGWLDAGGVAAVQGAHALFSRVQGAVRLLTDEALDPDSIGTGGQGFLARVAGAGDAAQLAETLDKARADALCCLDAVFGAVTEQDKS